MRKITIILAILVMAVMALTPITEWAMGPGEYWKETAFQTGPQAALIYRCHRYGKAWPKGMGHPDEVTLAGAMMMLAYESAHYDPRGAVFRREVKALAHRLGGEASFN